MNELKLFNFNDSEVRVLKINDQPWFVAKDIAEILGYENSRTMTRRLDDDEKGVQNLHTLGGIQELTVINESGLYNAILGSNKPEARRFKKWVTVEVLPSIRRDGAFVAATQEMSDEEIMARALFAAKRAIDRKDAQIAEQERRIGELAPDAEYAQKVLVADNLHTINAVAVHLGISAIKLNRFLETEGWIYRQGCNIYPSAKIREKGYCDFHIVPYAYDAGGNIKTREHLKWTEAGRRAIIELYKQKAAA